MRRNDPKLVAEMIKFAYDCLRRTIRKKMLEIPYLWDGDAVDVTFVIKIDANGIRLMAEKVNVELEVYPDLIKLVDLPEEIE